MAIGKMFLKKGAELEGKDEDSCTPLSRATENGDESTIEPLRI